MTLSFGSLIELTPGAAYRNVLRFRVVVWKRNRYFTSAFPSPVLSTFM